MMHDWTEATEYGWGQLAHGYRSATYHGVYDDLLEQFQPIRMVRMAMLEPGGFIANHVDGEAVYYERWHVPIEPAGWVWQEDEGFLHAPDEPFRVAHWRNHAVGNPSKVQRIHVVLDRDIEVRRGDGMGAVRHPNLPEIDELIARI